MVTSTTLATRSKFERLCIEIDMGKPLCASIGWGERIEGCSVKDYTICALSVVNMDIVN